MTSHCRQQCLLDHVIYNIEPHWAIFMLHWTSKLHFLLHWTLSQKTMFLLVYPNDSRTFLGTMQHQPCPSRLMVGTMGTFFPSADALNHDALSCSYNNLCRRKWLFIEVALIGSNGFIHDYFNLLKCAKNKDKIFLPIPF